MNTLILTMKVLPPTLNDIIALARRNKFASASEKKQWTEDIATAARNARVSSFQGAIYLEYVWRVKNFRRDQDNITSAQKYILDGLVTGNVIAEDNISLIQSPVVHWFEKADHDGFSIILRDKDAWDERRQEFSLDSEYLSPSIINEIILELPKRVVRQRSSSVKSKATSRRKTAKRVSTRVKTRRTISRRKSS